MGTRCNPLLTQEAFKVEGEIGLLLPWDVVVHQGGTGSRVIIVDPEAALSTVQNGGRR